MTKYRMYDYAIGRFLNVDPLADAAAQESLTPYHYVRNNPINYNDPYGDCDWCRELLSSAANAVAKQVKSAVLGVTEAVSDYVRGEAREVAEGTSVKVDGKLTIGPQAGVEAEGGVNAELNIAAFEIVSGEMTMSTEGTKTKGNNIFTGDVVVTQGVGIGLGPQVKAGNKQVVGQSGLETSIEEITPIVPGVVNAKETSTEDKNGKTTTTKSIGTGYSFSFIIGVDINISIQQEQKPEEE